MQITLEIPDDLAAALAQPGRDLARAALEACGLEADRQRRITGYQLRTLLGIRSRYEFDGFLKEHQVEKYTAEDFEHDLATTKSSPSSLPRWNVSLKLAAKFNFRVAPMTTCSHSFSCSGIPGCASAMPPCLPSNALKR